MFQTRATTVCETYHSSGDTQRSHMHHLFSPTQNNNLMLNSHHVVAEMNLKQCYASVLNKYLEGTWDKVLKVMLNAPSFHHIFNCLYILAVLLLLSFNNVFWKIPKPEQILTNILTKPSTSIWVSVKSERINFCLFDQSAPFQLYFSSFSS